MLDVQEMNDAPGTEELGENGKPGRLSGGARLQSAASILATAGLRRLFEKFEVEAGIYGHAGDGELHIMVSLDLRRPEEAARMTALAESCRRAGA